MKNNRILTKYTDVNVILAFLKEKIVEIFGLKVVGIYITGSLSYGDFDLETSDIDVVAVIKKQADRGEIVKIEKLYLQIRKKFPAWLNRIECSFTPAGMLNPSSKKQGHIW
jgi:predicted nucleotidyltransferase